MANEGQNLLDSADRLAAAKEITPAAALERIRVVNPDYYSQGMADLATQEPGARHRLEDDRTSNGNDLLSAAEREASSSGITRLEALERIKAADRAFYDRGMAEIHAGPAPPEEAAALARGEVPAAVEFVKTVTRIMEARGLSRPEADRVAMREHPDLWKRVWKP